MKQNFPGMRFSISPLFPDIHDNLNYSPGSTNYFVKHSSVSLEIKHKPINIVKPIRLKKRINSMSQSCRMDLFFWCTFDSAKFKLFIFFCLLFFFSFLWTCLSNYAWKDMTDTIKYFEQQTPSTLCPVLYLVHPHIKYFIFHTEQLCDRLKSDTSAA